jgi:hypothetical protein
MGAPTSAILAEVYIQYMEHKELYTVLRICQIFGCFRYVDDIIIIYDRNVTNIDEPLADSVKRELVYNSRLKKNNTTPLISWTLQCTEKRIKLEFAMYMKILRKQIP